MLLQHVLFCTVSSEKSAVIFVFVSFYVRYLFFSPLAPFLMFPFITGLEQFEHDPLCNFLYFLHFGFIELLGSVGLYFSSHLKIFRLLFLQIFFFLFLTLFSFRDSNYMYIRHLDWLFKKIFFSLSFISDGFYYYLWVHYFFFCNACLILCNSVQYIFILHIVSSLEVRVGSFCICKVSFSFFDDVEYNYNNWSNVFVC